MPQCGAEFSNRDVQQSTSTMTACGVGECLRGESVGAAGIGVHHQVFMTWHSSAEDEKARAAR